jgi:hypothetical protein
MKEEEGDETKQNCNNIHDLVTTKEKEGNHQHNTITTFKAQEQRRKVMHLICLKLTMKQYFEKPYVALAQQAPLALAPNHTLITPTIL